MIGNPLHLSGPSLEKVPKSTENFHEVLKSSERVPDAVPVQDALRDLENICTNDGINARISASRNEKWQIGHKFMAS